MAHGCPIVSTCVGGIPEIVQDGVSGLLCPPENPQCLAEKILLMIEDFELRQRLGHAARAAFEAGSFQMPALSSHLASTYQEVLSEKSRTVSG